MKVAILIAAALLAGCTELPPRVLCDPVSGEAFTARDNGVGGYLATRAVKADALCSEVRR